MQEIIQGNLFSPDFVSIPTIQAPIMPTQPISYGRGQSFSVFVKYPVGTKKLLFTVTGRIYSPNKTPVFQQIVFPDVKEAGVAEFFVGEKDTLAMEPDLYYWDVFQLRDDGSRDIWSPYNTGTFSIFNYPSSPWLNVDIRPDPETGTAGDYSVILYNMEIPQGDTWCRKINWTADGEPVDTTGYTASMRIKLTTISPTSIIELTTENGRIVLGGENGLITLQLTPAQTNGISPGQYYYDLDLLGSNGYVQTIMRGMVNVFSEI
jgi:hypothetical protein